MYVYGRRYIHYYAIYDYYYYDVGDNAIRRFGLLSFSSTLCPPDSDQYAY